MSRPRDPRPEDRIGLLKPLPLGFVWDIDYGGMCPNCNTPWKCNGPHIQPPGGWPAYIADA